MLAARNGTKIRSARSASNDARRGIVTLGVSVGGPTCKASGPGLGRTVRRHTKHARAGLVTSAPDGGVPPLIPR
ncbi:hypothetical protein RR42_m0613 [Cupriavidus basilensis]|uniref:Uncharacterized protein n=1 Tax=Cupriavidus basilensis TaxID=68895 RepID=A0A0C4YBR3_9BURK|nr:hypothetical protein RR42_m0613 [Cupriavidus basilensis]